MNTLGEELSESERLRQEKWNKNFGNYFQARRIEIVRHMLNMTYNGPPSKCLDVGSGGPGLLATLGINSISFDIYRFPGITLVASAESLPFADESFDLVLAGEVIEHLSSPSKALREWSRVLEKNGTLILSTPNGILVGTEGNNPGHRFAFSLNGLKTSLALLGLKVTMTRTIYAAFASKRVFAIIPSWLKVPILRVPIPSVLSYNLIIKSKKR